MGQVKYYARFSYNDEGPDVVRIGVSFPDLPGCFSCGDTKDEAIDMAKEALELWLDTDEDDTYPINPPSRLCAWFEEHHSRGAEHLHGLID